MTNWSADRSDTGLHQVAYEYFFYYNLQTGEYIPWLAESYEYNADFTRPDRQAAGRRDLERRRALHRRRRRLHLRHHAGEPDDVVGGRGQRGGDVGREGRRPHRHLQPDRRPTRASTSTARPSRRSASGAASRSCRSTSGKDEDPLTFKNNPPVSTGPYRLKDATQTAVIWERRDDWWGTEVFGVTPGPRGGPVPLPRRRDQRRPRPGQQRDRHAEHRHPLGRLLPGSRQPQRERPRLADGRALRLGRSLPARADGPERDAAARQARRALGDLLPDRPASRSSISPTKARPFPAWGIWPEYEANLPYFEAIDDLREQYPIGHVRSGQAAELLRRRPASTPRT